MIRKVADVLMALLFLAMSALWFGMAVPTIVLASLAGAVAIVIIASMLADRPA